MKISNNGIDLIKSFEGLRLKAYKDSVGVPTIGYGHTKNVKMGDVISLKTAEQFLLDDIRIFEEGVLALVKIEITQNMFDALVSFSFNLGLGNLAKSTLLKKINSKLFKEAGNEFVRWNKAGGVVLKGLTRRRLLEKELFLKQ